jgi:hypothetical protein
MQRSQGNPEVERKKKKKKKKPATLRIGAHLRHSVGK